MSDESKAVPSIGLRIKAALTTTVVAIVTAIAAGIVTAPIIWAVTDHPLALSGGFGPLGGGVHGGGPTVPLTSGDIADAVRSVNGWIAIAVDLTIFVIVVLVTSNRGRGALGDRIYDIQAVNARGTDAERWRNLANVALPVLVWVVANAFTNQLLGVVAVGVVWLPAVFRADRRSLYSLVTGTHYAILPGFVRRKGRKEPPVQISQ
jgi:hypothetical protein